MVPSRVLRKGRRQVQQLVQKVLVADPQGRLDREQDQRVLAEDLKDL
jgi:hypothetical protein